VFRELAEAPVNYASSTGPIRGGSGGRVRPYRGAARENELSKKRYDRRPVLLTAIDMAQRRS
jgi:hypothetical protein